MDQKRLLEYVKRFQKVAETVEKDIQEKAKTTDIKKMKGTEFEDVVYEALKENSFKPEQITHSAQKFPDFIIEDDMSGDKIGIEVKKTNDAKWEVQGGSVFESLKNEVEDTYILMGKFGGDQPEARIRKYEECLQDLRVTHSPRFYINLDLPEGEDYLTKKDAKDLLTLSGDELNRKIRQLLRSNHSTWWSEEETTAWDALSGDEKEIYLNDGIALFPEIFNSDYSNFTPWLVYSCLVWCGHVRDIFTAGGVKLLEEEKLYVSAIMNRALNNKDAIISRINDMTDDEINKFWKVEKIEDGRVEKWIELVCSNLKFSKDLLNKNRALDSNSDLDDEELVEKIRDTYREILLKQFT